MIRKQLGHVAFLVGVLLITLLTSGQKAMAEDFAVTVIGDYLKVSPETTDGTVSGFLVEAEDGYKVGEITAVSVGENSLIAESDYTIEENKVNISATIDGDVTITATAVAKSSVATLKSLSYKLGSGAAVFVPGFTAGTNKYDLTALSFTKEETVTLEGVVTDASNATITTPVAATITTAEDGTQSATATITVTAEDETTTSTYTVNFAFLRAKITKITAPTVAPFGAIVVDAAAACKALNSLELKATIEAENTTTELPVVWTYDKAKNETEEYNPASGEKNKFTWTATVPTTMDVNGQTATGEVEVTNHTLKATTKLFALTYAYGDVSAASVTGFSDDKTQNAYTVAALPFGTKQVTVVATTEEGATVKVKGSTEPATTTVTVTLDLTQPTKVITFTITPEDGTSSTREVAVTFTLAKDKIAVITPPVAPVLTADESLDELVIAKLPKTLQVTTTSGVTDALALAWAIKDETTFTADAGATNVYTWTATLGEELDQNGQTLTGDLDVVNFIAAVTGDQTASPVTVDKIDADNKIGDGSSETTAKTVNIDGGVKSVTFDKVTVTSKVDIKGAAAKVVFKDATVKEIAVAVGATTIELSTGNTIEKITNLGTLTLKNAESKLRAAVALTNSGAVKAVVNNGTFTDETATITDVTGTGEVSISELPVGGSTEADKLELSIGTTGTTIEWQYLSNNGWSTATGTATNATYEATASGSYRCKVSVTNTTLYTKPVRVTVNASAPLPTFTVSLPAVTGATFNKDASTVVDEGADFSFTITLDKEYDQSVPVVKADGVAITAVNGVYTVKNIRKNTAIAVTGIVKNVATGIDGADNSTRIWSDGATLYISTDKAEIAYIINASGVAKQIRVAGDYSTQPGAGFYIVRVGDLTKKVIIK